MTYRGRVKNGVVVLEPWVHLREGMDVRVEPVGETQGIAEGSQEAQQLREGLLAFSGVIKEGPSTWRETMTITSTGRRENERPPWTVAFAALLLSSRAGRP